MRLTKLLGLMALALLAFGAIGTTMASATELSEESGKPQILCFVEGCIKELQIPATGGASTFETLGALSLTGTSVTLTIKGVKELEGSKGKDGGLAEDVEIKFEGVKKGETNCSTAGLKSEQGQVAALLDLHVSAGTKGGVLVPLLLAKFLTKELKPELEIKCALVKVIVKGTLPCAITPGLTAIPTTAAVTVECNLNKTTHDQATGIICTVLCTENEKDPFEIKFGERFEDAGFELKLSGKPSKEIYIDD